MPRRAAILAVVCLLLALLCWAAVLLLTPRIVLGQAAPTLERIGPNADRPLHPGERGWLIGPDQPMPSDGARVALLGCNAVACVWSVEPTRLDWRVGSVRQGARLWFPLAGRVTTTTTVGRGAAVPSACVAWVER